MCRKEVPVELYNKNKAKSDGLTNSCKPCMVKYQAAHYQRNKEKMNAKALARQKATKVFWKNLKDNKPCMDCKVVHRYIALEYDHRDSSTKTEDVSVMTARGLSRKTILKEIAKCDMVCANCHRYRTLRRLENGTGDRT